MRTHTQSDPQIVRCLLKSFSSVEAHAENPLADTLLSASAPFDEGTLYLLSAHVHTCVLSGEFVLECVRGWVEFTEPNLALEWLLQKLKLPPQ